MKFQSKIERFVRNISPSVWPLIFAMCFILLGTTIPLAGILIKLGLFVVVIYVVIWVTWIIFQSMNW